MTAGSSPRSIAAQWLQNGSSGQADVLASDLTDPAFDTPACP